jgi:tetratricopeptide (TPR) repeat protein
MKNDEKTFRIAYIILILFFILRFIPFIFPESRMWGFNFLLFLPVPYTVVYVILTVAAIILPFIKRFEGINEQIINGYSAVFCESSNKYYARLAVTFVCTILFLLFLADTHFLGDGYAVIANLASETGSFIKWSEMGVTHFLLSLQSLVGPKSEEAALSAFRIVSVFSGIFSVWIFFLISQEISEDKTKRFLTFLMLIMSGGLLLFFGYAENYPLLWVAFPGFAYFGLRYINRDKWLIGPIVFLALGMFTHMQAVQMIPAFILLIFCKGWPRRLYDRFKFIFWILAGIITVILLMRFHHQYITDLYIEDIFLPMFEGKPSDPDCLIFSLTHLADIFSHLLLLSPLVYLVFIMSIKRLPRLFKRADTIFLLLLTLTGLGFLMVIDPKLGMARDWDLLSLAAFGLTLLTVHLLGKNQILALKRLILPIVIYAVCAALPYLFMNLTPVSAVKYVKYFINLDIQKSLPATVVLRTYYKKQEYQPAVDSLDALYNKRYQNKIKIRQAINSMHSGDLETARRLAATIKPLRFFANYHDMLSNLYRHAGDQDRALEEYGKVISLQRYNHNVWLNRARTLIALRRFDEAVPDLRKALHLHNNSLTVFDGFATIHLYQEQWDSTIYYSEKMLKIDSTSFAALYFLAVAYQYLGDEEKFAKYKEKYVIYGKKDNVYDKRLESLGID